MILLSKLDDDDEVVLEVLEVLEVDFLADGLTKASATAALLLLAEAPL